MKKWIQIIVVIAITTGCLQARDTATVTDEFTPEMEWFKDAKFGVMVCWGIYSVNGDGASWPIFNGKISYEDYMKQCDSFTAENYDPEAWAKLFKKTGIKMVYALLTDLRLDKDWGNDLLNVSVRELADKARMSTGSISELVSEMKERGFLLADGRFKRLVNRKMLVDQWLHGYMDYRFTVKKQCFEAESISWWRYRKPESEGFLWGGEPAAAILTNDFLRPERLTLYTDKPLYDLVVDGALHQTPSGGHVEFIEPLMKTGGNQGCVHPLLVYADLICSSDDRNTETATRVYDRYLQSLIESA